MSKKRIMFVCTGNICRSPMGEYILRRMAEDAGIGDRLEISSAGTSDEEYGNPVYPPAASKLRQHGISCKGHRARQITATDYEVNDLLIAMDRQNLRSLLRMTNGDPLGKIRILGDYTDGKEVADPWYTDDFDTAYRMIEAGCRAILRLETDGLA